MASANDPDDIAQLTTDQVISDLNKQNAAAAEEPKSNEFAFVISDKEHKALVPFREALPPEYRNVDDITGVRFLRARKLKVNAAVEMYKNMMQWRKENDVDKILEPGRPYDDVLKYLVSNEFHGEDKHGRVIYIEKTGKIHCATFAKLIPDAIIIKTHVWFMETIAQKLRDSSLKKGYPVTQMVFILDFKGLSLEHRKMSHMFTAVTQIDQDYYPECLGSMWFLNTPWIFGAIWKLIAPLLDAKTRSKIHILRDDFTELVDELGADSLPEEYGGTCRCEGGCMPKVYTMDELEEMKIGVQRDDALEVEAQEMTVARGSKFELPINALAASKDQPVCLQWYFTTAKRDISFHAEFRPKDPASCKKIITHANRLNSYEVPQKGEYVVDEPGTCYFTWDNSYSRFTSKTLRYVVKTI